MIKTLYTSPPVKGETRDGQKKKDTVGERHRPTDRLLWSIGRPTKSSLSMSTSSRALKVRQETDRKSQTQLEKDTVTERQTDRQTAMVERETNNVFARVV